MHIIYVTELSNINNRTYAILPQAGTPHYGIPMVKGMSSSSLQVQASTVTEIGYRDSGSPRAQRVKRLPCAQSTSIIRKRISLSAATLPKDPRSGPKWETKSPRIAFWVCCSQAADEKAPAKTAKDSKGPQKGCGHVFFSQNKHRSLSNRNEAFQISNASFSLQSGSYSHCCANRETAKKSREVHIHKKSKAGNHA